MARRVSVRRRVLKAAGVAVLTSAVSVAAAVAGGGGSAFAADPAGAVAPVANPAGAVNPLLGTGDGGAGGAVNAFPGPDVPFGMVQWGPDTSPNRQAGGGYYYNDSAISGFSLTHMSGPGCGAFGDVPILPTVGALPTDPSHVTVPFSHSNESASADYYSVVTGTGSSAVKTELTETARSAAGRFTFPASAQSNLLFKLTGSQNGTNGVSAQVVGSNEIQGSVTSGHFCGANDEYTLNFDIVFDQPFTAHGTWTGNTVTPNAAAPNTGTPNAVQNQAPSTKASPSPAAPSPSPSPAPNPATPKPAAPGTSPAPKGLPAPTLHGQAPRASTTTKQAATAAAAGPDGLYLTFDTTANQTLQAKVGISYVSAANAQANLQAEQPAWTFDAVHAAGVAAWNQELSHI